MAKRESNYERVLYKKSPSRDGEGKIFKAVQYTGGNVSDIKNMLNLIDAFVDADGTLSGITKARKKMKIRLEDYIVYVGDGEYIAVNERTYKELYRRT